MADEVIERITAVVQRGLDGERAAACEELETLWVEHTDPLHRCVIAHFLADLQDDVHAELLWDERALAAAGEIGDDQVREIAPGLQVRGFLPSLYGSVADDHRRGLAANLLGQLGRLGEGAERVLVEVARVVVQGVNQNPGHQTSFLSSSQATILLTVSSVSSSSKTSPGSFAGGGLIASTRVFEPSMPTSLVSMPTSAADFVSSGFFFAPMIALSDG